MGHRVTSATTVSVLYKETRLSREAESREKETDTERKEERWRKRESDQTPSVLHLTMLLHSAWPKYSLGGSRNGLHPPPHHPRDLCGICAPVSGLQVPVDWRPQVPRPGHSCSFTGSHLFILGFHVSG